MDDIQPETRCDDLRLKRNVRHRSGQVWPAKAEEFTMPNHAQYVGPMLAVGVDSAIIS